MNIQGKINKLILALRQKGYIYTVNKEQFMSKSDKLCTMYKSFHLMPVSEYNLKYPDDKKDPDKYRYVKVELVSSFSLIDILKALADTYKEVGVSSG